MTLFQQIAAALNWNLRVNENFVSVSPAGMYGRDPATTTGLTWGYLGGNFNGVVVASGTVSLTASNNNYVVAHRTTGVVSAAITTTNWLNTGTYLPLYAVTAGASSVTSYDDFRQAIGGGASGAMTNPMTASGDVIYGGAAGAPTRLAASTNGYVLTLAAGVPTWAAATGGFSNPMTTSGDLILGGASGAAGRLGIGSNGQVLTVTSGVVGWAAASSGFANPMTTVGDLIVGGASGAAARYAAGTSGYVLTSTGPGSAPTWQASTGGGTVTSVAAQGGVETVSGSAITASGTVQSNTLVNAQSGTTYTYLTGDRAKLVTHTNASAIAGTLPQAGSAGFPAGWFMELKNIGAGTLTVTPTTSTIDGSSNTALTTGQSIVVVSDGTNWITLSGKSSGGGGLTNWTDSVNTATPNATTPVAVLTATNAATNADAAIVPKAQGAILAQVPDNTSTGGNKRGAYAVDFQRNRSAAANVASGNYSFVGSGNNNKASGTESVVVGGSGNAATTSDDAVLGGTSNTASGGTSFVGGGNANTASGSMAAVGGGNANTASGNYSFIGGGNANTATGQYSSAFGFKSHTHGITGMIAHANGILATPGDAQVGRYVFNTQTSSATPKALGSAFGTASAGNTVVLSDTSTFDFTVNIVARNGTTASASYKIEGTAKRGSGAATTALVGTPTVTPRGVDSGASSWAVAVVANTSLGSIDVQVTGAAATTVNWMALVETVEIIS